MKVKEDLVYDKGTGELIGFTNVGVTNNHLHLFEHALTNSKKLAVLKLATSMLNCFLKYLHGYRISVCIFFVHQSNSTDVVFRDTVRCSKLGLGFNEVLALTADGIATNLKSFHMPSIARSGGEDD